MPLIGLSQASYSIAYIFAPSIMGFVADRVGYNSTFAIIGLFTAVAAAILLIITPKKLRLPQKEINSTN
jgi:MFS family permease